MIFNSFAKSLNFSEFSCQQTLSFWYFIRLVSRKNSDPILDKLGQVQLIFIVPF